MLFEGVLTKMQTEFAEPVNYYLKLGNDFVQFFPAFVLTIYPVWLIHNQLF